MTDIRICDEKDRPCHFSNCLCEEYKITMTNYEVIILITYVRRTSFPDVSAYSPGICKQVDRKEVNTRSRTPVSRDDTCICIRSNPPWQPPD